MQLAEIQSALRELSLDGWLFYDHHERDPLAYRVLGFRPARHVTRRWYYFIPAEGEPRGLVHRIEAGMLDALPGPKTVYADWRNQVEGLRALLAGSRAVAMQYSPRNAVPYVGMVDAGTVELVRSLGAEVVTSADLIQMFEARWSAAQLEGCLEAGRRVDEVRRAAFERIRAQHAEGELVTEWTIRNFILDSFTRAGLFTDHGPIVAVNDNASNPHYEPSRDMHRPIRPGDVILLDMWAKLAGEEDSVYYDITWTGYTGAAPPSDVLNVFGIVREARDRGVEFVQRAVRERTDLRGFQVDDVVRGHIVAAGYGEWFPHRTGHSIGREVHGAGANMDNLETHDDRRVIAGTCFSIEPGIYLPRFGIRSEVNVYAGEAEAIVTGEAQQALVIVA